MIHTQAAGNDAMLYFDNLPAANPSVPVNIPAKAHHGIQHLDAVVAAHIQTALARSGGKVEGAEGAANRLGIHPSTLRGKMKRLGIAYGRISKQN